jgi:hypothetical protein
MIRKMGSVLLVVAAVIVLAIAVPVAFSQMEQGQLVYTYVSQFQVSRANWAAYSEDSEKSFIPVVEKLTADGTILNWDTFETVVHTSDGYTHGASWSSSSIAGLMKVLDQLRKNGPSASQNAATKHEDFLMQTRMYHAGSGTAAYLRVICSNAKPDKPAEFTTMLKKLLVPTFEEQLKKGTATYWGVDEQYVNTMTPSVRCVVVTYPNAESIDTWAAAINTTMGKWTAAERAEYLASTVADSRRDMMARITHSGHK